MALVLCNYDFTSDWSIGRFTQTDPILENRPNQHYAYGNNNPVSIVDPMGLEGWA